jgi:hypothetical protein
MRSEAPKLHAQLEAIIEGAMTDLEDAATELARDPAEMLEMIGMSGSSLNEKFGELHGRAKKGAAVFVEGLVQADRIEKKKTALRLKVEAAASNKAVDER